MFNAVGVFGESISMPFLYSNFAFYQFSANSKISEEILVRLWDAWINAGNDPTSSGIDVKKGVGQQLVHAFKKRCQAADVPTLTDIQVRRMVVQAHTCIAFANGLTVRLDGQKTRWDFEEESIVFDAGTGSFECVTRNENSSMPPFVTVKNLVQAKLPARDAKDWAAYLNDGSPTHFEQVHAPRAPEPLRPLIALRRSIPVLLIRVSRSTYRIPLLLPES